MQYVISIGDSDNNAKAVGKAGPEVAVSNGTKELKKLQTRLLAPMMSI